MHQQGKITNFRRSYNILSAAIAMFFVAIIINLQLSNIALSWVCGVPGDYNNTYGDSSTITNISGSTSVSPTASLSLSKTSVASSAVTPGIIATADTAVTVKISNASSYSLSLKFDKTNLTNGSTTITAGNPSDSSKSNVWGYKWDTETSYTTPSTNAKNISNLPALDSNGTANFTKTLYFGAKFATGAEAGHYTANGTLSLTVSPKTVSITLGDLTQMQQLSLVPEACANTPYLSGKNYSDVYTLTDVRDNAEYKVAKLGDGKCWMVSNLKISSDNPSTCGIRKLDPTTSDIGSEWTMPRSTSSGFSDSVVANSYVQDDTGYYSWCAATADTCSSATTADANAPSSICPKGWKLPTGMVTGSNTTNEFYNLFNAINSKTTIVSGTLSPVANTNWATNGLSTVQSNPYNFAFTGYVYNSNYYIPANDKKGYWWSSTTNRFTDVHILYLGSSDVSPGIGSAGRHLGYAVRCVAR